LVFGFREKHLFGCREKERRSLLKNFLWSEGVVRQRETVAMKEAAFHGSSWNHVMMVLSV
jgi:hypothetical protein